MHTDGLAGRQSPRCGGPDNGFNRFQLLTRELKHLRHGFGIQKLKRHIQSRRHFVFVFHFRFSQGRATFQTEMHGFLAFNQVTGFLNFAQIAHDVGFGAKIHGFVRIVPIADDAQADKVFFLTRNLLFGVFTAQLAEFGSRDFLAIQFFYHQFNWQSVAIPTGYIRRIKARPCFGAHNHVFQYFVDCMTNVNVTVGIRRAIV